MVKNVLRQIFHSNIIKNACFIAFLTLTSIESGYIYARSNCPDQGPRLSAAEYCRLYAAEAQRQMKLYGIPASITLAQGMFESAYGASYIAVKANNHFGIKAYRGWSGPVVRCDDDSSNEPFCKFNTVREGYEYHSKFLKNSTRYASLFKLDHTDYKGWAKGLQKCGYATNPKYPDLLCDVIERYNLMQYDKASNTSAASSASKGSKSNASTSVVSKPVSTHRLYSTAKRHGLKYVEAKKNDDLNAIAKEFKVPVRQLKRWNDMPKNYRLKEGERIYMQAKKSKADRSCPTHKVASGESLHSISQKYGVTVKSIVKRNKLTSATIRKGQVLKLR